MNLVDFYVFLILDFTVFVQLEETILNRSLNIVSLKFKVSMQ